MWRSEAGRDEAKRSEAPEQYRVIKKPDPRVMAYAQKVMHVADASKIAMIGDRVFTDVLGGNLAGCFTIQIYPPFYPESEPKYLKPTRWMEKLVHRVYGLTHRDHNL